MRIFTIDGEEVYSTDLQGTTGTNTLIWEAENQAREAVASGLYVYVLHVQDGTSQETKTGKIALIH